MKNIKNILFTLIAVASTAFCIFTQEQTCSEPPVITIFVHGSKPQIPDFFYKQGKYYFLPGLHHVDDLMKNLDEQARPESIINGLKKSGYVDFKHLYFFGWSGKIDFDVRGQTAIELKKAIEKLLAEKYKGIKLKLHIITHSHGGNVALNLAHELEINQSDIIIDELILLALPVQPQTKDYIAIENIGKIYNYYSEDDWTQLADPQGLQRYLNNKYTHNKKLFSEHTFDHHENLTQLRIKINDIDPWHITFIDYYPPLLFFKDLPERFPHRFPRFLPDLGDIMYKVKDNTTQERIQQHKKPVKVSIDTHKARGDNERIKISHPE